MYQYNYYTMNITIILEYVARVHHTRGAETFKVYLTDNDEPYNIPTNYYDDFMDKLKSYVKSQAQ